MNISKIKALDNKVNREAEKFLKALYKKYNKQMNDLISEVVPKGEVLTNGNGISILETKERSGKAWGIINRKFRPRLYCFITIQQRV